MKWTLCERIGLIILVITDGRVIIVMQLGALEALSKVTRYSCELDQHQKNDCTVFERYFVQAWMLEMTMMCEKQ
jgi:hypothetical protein